MSDHYFSNAPSVSSRPHVVHFRVRDREIQLKTDAGVFSKQGLDYGTRVLIESADLSGAKTVVDLGCGYGPVTATLAGIYPEVQWLLLDVNERAVTLARENTSTYSGRVECCVSDGFSGVPAERRFDAVLLNPPIRAGKAVIYRLFDESFSRLETGGTLWIVIQKKQGAPSAERKLRDQFASVELVERDGGYHVYKCIK